MLIGSYQHNVDSKFRVTMPSKWRGELGEKLILIKGVSETRQGEYLHAMTETAFQRKFSAFSDLNLSDVAGRKFMRMIYSSAKDVELDGSGRIVIPPELRKCAGIGSCVVLVGMEDGFEIWDEQVWNEMNAEPENEMDWKELLAKMEGKDM